MKPCWVFMILLSCGLSHATETQSICACKEQLKIVCVPAGHNVTVPCPELEDKELAFYLYKEEEVYNRACPHDKNTTNCTTTREDVTLQVNTENKAVNFMLTGVNASSYGIYKCERVVVFPPPLLKVNSSVWILVRVEGHQCKVNERRINNFTESEIDGDQKDEPLNFWIWILVLVLLCIYGLTVTVIAVIILVKWRRTDSQSDYMNTKPKAGRDRKKKRGVQNPFPRYL